MNKAIKSWTLVWLKIRFYFDLLLTSLMLKTTYPPFSILFIHIPKTAGTSFRIMLFKKIPQKVIFPNWKNIAKNQGEYPALQQTESFFKKPLKKLPLLIFGHFPYALKNSLPVKYECFIFLRDPVSRTISNLLHFQRSIPEYKSLSLGEIFIRYKYHLHNLQTRYLCDDSVSQSMFFNHKKGLDKTALDQAKKNLENCTFIGITERFQESIIICEQLIGLRLGEAITRNVSAKKKPRETMDPNLISLIKPHLLLDIELYQHALQLFEKRKSLILEK